MLIVPMIIMCAGIFTAALCLPLMQGKIGPNRFYGIRTPVAFSSEENWYRMQRFGGKVFVASSCLIALVGAVGFLVPAAYFVVYAIIAAVITLGMTIGAGIIVLLKS